jgi:MtrB/PioB family decaheme-associated outer membrane protein
VVQLPEPIDYRTEDIRFTLHYNGDRCQLDTIYHFSQFDNGTDALTWNSLFHAPGFINAAATDYDDIRNGIGGTSYATTGRMGLDPDNTYHHLALNVGASLPWESRLSASAAAGRMKQDEALLPYATSDFGATLASLPRSSADAEIDTAMLNLVYTFQPIRRLNANIHYRYYELDNNTPQDVFHYYTQDTNNHGYLNERINIGYGYTQNKLGLELGYYLGKAGTLRFAYDNEKRDRDFREVDETDEDTFKLSCRVHPFERLWVNATFATGKREGGEYNGEVTDLSYHYDPTDPANHAQPNNPLLAFGNAPGLRKFDVTERDRDEFTFSVGFVPIETVNANLSYRGRKDDFASDTLSSISTWDSVAGTFVTVPIDPTQLGLLKDESSSLVLDLNYSPSQRMSLSGFYSRENLDSEQRGRYLDENNRVNDIASGKDWQDTSGDFLWNADFADETDALGIGTNFVIGVDFTSA